MAAIMTKRGTQDNIVTYEFFCDTIADRNTIERKYRTLGTIAIVLQGTGGMEVYIANSDGNWYEIGMGGNSGEGSDSETIPSANGVSF